TQFDPEVVRQFLAVGLPRLRRAMGPVAWLGQLPFVRSWPRLEAAGSTAAAHAATATAAASTAGLLALGSGNAATAVASAGGRGTEDGLRPGAVLGRRHCSEGSSHPSRHARQAAHHAVVRR